MMSNHALFESMLTGGTSCELPIGWCHSSAEQFTTVFNTKRFSEQVRQERTDIHTDGTIGAPAGVHANCRGTDCQLAALTPDARTSRHCIKSAHGALQILAAAQKQSRGCNKRLNCMLDTGGQHRCFNGSHVSSSCSCTQPGP